MDDGVREVLASMKDLADSAAAGARQSSEMIEKKLGDFNSRIDDVHGRITGIDQRLSRIEGKLGSNGYVREEACRRMHEEQDRKIAQNATDIRLRAKNSIAVAVPIVVVLIAIVGSFLLSYSRGESAAQERGRIERMINDLQREIKEAKK